MFKWEDKYSVGIQSIDNQHKELFLILERLVEAMKKGVANSITNQIIMDLESYALIHFQKEEYFFQRFNFEGSAEHTNEHQIFLKKVDSLKSDLKSGKITLTFDLLNFLKEWIDHHLLVVDQKYIECFRQNGLK